MRLFLLSKWQMTRSKTVFLIAILMAAIASAQASQAMVVIANVDQVEGVDKAELQRIYKMRQKVWSNKQPIHVFVLPNEDDKHQSFVQDNLGLSVNQLNRAWSRLVFTGRGIVPTQVKSEAEMIQKIKKTPGAIGYVSQDKAKDSQLSELKVFER